MGLRGESCCPINGTGEVAEMGQTWSTVCGFQGTVGHQGASGIIAGRSCFMLRERDEY